ncbi:signal peptidase I [Brachybacterium sp. AOP43-C2-M15]|uniref:signal peptidase I n=1 Tax=Brachybacterium sp. AOP43-C2-M15 TaxID=3457661 RepID=UPI004033A174
MTARGKRSAGPRFLRSLGDHLLTLLAVGGAVCIVLVLLSWVLSISIMMFRTGSMSPTITAGSIAVVREIPAVEMTEGDVVTVDRGEGVLPVTHRVLEVLEVDHDSGEVTFTMQGDANEVADPSPYTATDVRRVMFSVPAAARVIQWFSDPFVLGGITVGATVLVVWAFWPRERTRDGSDEDFGEDLDGDSEGDSDGVSDDDCVEIRGSSAHDALTRHTLVVPVVAALILAAPAAGSTETTFLSGDHLRIRTEGDPALMKNLAPGDSAVWEVGVWAETPEPGEIDLGLTGRGELAEVGGALAVSVDACTSPWTGGTCSTGAMEMVENASLDSIAARAGSLHLTSMPSDEQRWLRITVTLATDAGPRGLSGARGDVLIEAFGAGEHLSAGLAPSSPAAPGADGTGAGGLASTGAGGVLPLVLLASALALIGAALHRKGRQSA